MTPDEALKIVYTEVEYAYDDKIKDKSNRNWNEDYEHYRNYRHAMATIEKSLKALEIIKERFVWLENGELYCGRINDIQTPIDEEIEGKEEMELLKEVLQ